MIEGQREKSATDVSALLPPFYSLRYQAKENALCRRPDALRNARARRAVTPQASAQARAPDRHADTRGAPGLCL
eukprot:1446516-Pleurochrysis_carterae.AAC.1